MRVIERFGGVFVHPQSFANSNETSWNFFGLCQDTGLICPNFIHVYWLAFSKAQCFSWQPRDRRCWSVGAVFALDSVLWMRAALGQGRRASFLLFAAAAAPSLGNCQWVVAVLGRFGERWESWGFWHSWLLDPELVSGTLCEIGLFAPWLSWKGNRLCADWTNFICYGLRSLQIV